MPQAQAQSKRFARGERHWLLLWETSSRSSLGRARLRAQLCGRGVAEHALYASTRHEVDQARIITDAYCAAEAAEVRNVRAFQEHDHMLSERSPVALLASAVQLCCAFASSASKWVSAPLVMFGMQTKIAEGKYCLAEVTPNQAFSRNV